MDIARLIRLQLRDALRQAMDEGRTDVVIAANICAPGEATIVTNEDQVTVVQTDGETEVVDDDGREEGRGPYS